MNCRELDSFTLPYLDGELESDARSEIDAHLAACPACSARIHRDSAFREGFRAKARATLSESRAPDALRARIRRGIRSERRRTVTVRWVRVGAAAAVVVVVSAGGKTYWDSRTQRQVAHQVTTYHQRSVRPDLQDPAPEVAQAFVSNQMGRNLPLPHLANVALRSVRVGETMAQAVYEAPNGHLLSVFAYGDSEKEVPVDVQVENANGYNVALWREKETAYALVSDLTEDDILTLLRTKAGDSTPRPAFPALQRASDERLSERRAVPACGPVPCRTAPTLSAMPTLTGPLQAASFQQ